jgi:hypothetical protein
MQLSERHGMQKESRIVADEMADSVEKFGESGGI